MEAITELDAIHLGSVFLNNTVRLGDELGVNGVVERERTWGIRPFRDNAIVLRGNELQSSVNEVSEAGAEISSLCELHKK